MPAKASCHRGQPPPFEATAVRKVRPSSSGRFGGQAPRRGAARCLTSGRRQACKGEPSKPRQRVLQRRAAARFGPCGRNRAPWTVQGTLSGVPRSQVTATPSRWRPLGFVPTVAKRNARMPQGTRAAEVDALVSTPLRPGRLGPGSGRLLRRCALPSGRGRDLECDDPLRVGRERFSGR